MAVLLIFQVKMNRIHPFTTRQADLNLHSMCEKRSLWSHFSGHQWLCCPQFGANVHVSGQKRSRLQGIYQRELSATIGSWCDRLVVCIIVDRPEPSEEHPQGMCLDKGYDYEEVRAILSEFGKTRPHSSTRGRGSGDQEASWFQGTAVDGGTSAFLDEPLSAAARSLGEKTGELSGVSSFRLWLDRFSGHWVMRIGTESKRHHESMKPKALRKLICF